MWIHNVRCYADPDAGFASASTRTQGLKTARKKGNKNCTWKVFRFFVIDTFYSNNFEKKKSKTIKTLFNPSFQYFFDKFRYSALLASCIRTQEVSHNDGSGYTSLNTSVADPDP